MKLRIKLQRFKRFLNGYHDKEWGPASDLARPSHPLLHLLPLHLLGSALEPRLYLVLLVPLLQSPQQYPSEVLGHLSLLLAFLWLQSVSPHLLEVFSKIFMSNYIML